MSKFIYRIFILTALMSLCSFAAAAQDTDKPMTADRMARMVTELKGVVRRTANDDAASDKICKRWDARKDLKGKAKNAIIDLLYTDVKAIIKDSGKRYQIYSIFSMYRQMPDDKFDKKDPEADSDTSATKVDQPVGLTFQL